MDVNLLEVQRTSDTAFYSLELINKTGHKFPAGYPSRRAYIEFVVSNGNGDTIFHSGKADNEYRLVEEETSYENHYDVINSETQVQIYEMVMGDINSNVTTVLERPYSNLKDNRIPPKGFTSTHNSYDTVKVVGNADIDMNFNKDNGSEGTGSDIVYFNIPLNSYVGALNVTATIHYQPVPPKWTDEMFAHSSSEIDLFKGMYNNADHTPVKVAVAILNQTSRDELENLNINVFPNPVQNHINLEGLEDITDIVLFDNQGKIIKTFNWNQTSTQKLDVSGVKGIYHLKIKTKKGRYFSKKIIHL